MRASQLQAYIDAMECLSTEHERLVRAKCSETIAGIEEAIRTAWLPLRYASEVTLAVEDICGRESAATVSRRSIERSMQGTLLGPILGGLVRLGLGPEHAFKRAPAAWNLVYKNCGHLTFHDKTDHVLLRVIGAPALMRHAAYLRALSVSFEGMVFALGGEDAEVTYRESDTLVEFEIRWK